MQWNQSIEQLIRSTESIGLFPSNIIEMISNLQYYFHCLPSFLEIYKLGSGINCKHIMKPILDLTILLFDQKFSFFYKVPAPNHPNLSSV